MLVTLFKHNWKAHRSISITYLGYLILLLFVFNFQNIVTNSSYFLRYEEYFQENPIDYVSKCEIIPETLEIEDIEQEINDKNNQKSVAKHALLFYYLLNDVNLTVTYDEGQKNKTFFPSSLSIGALKEEQFEVLEEFQIYTNRTKIPPGGAQTLRTLTNKLNLSGIEQSDFSLISASTPEIYSIESRGSFSWYSSNLKHNQPVIDFFVPLNTFLNWFSNKSIQVITLIQQNRQWLYSFDNPQENYYIASSLDYSFNYIEILGSSTYYLTQNFFLKNRTPLSPNADFLIYSLPSILVGLLFCTLYTGLWSKQMLKTWLFFKPRGLDYNTFRASYLIYSGFLAFMATLTAAILSDLSENFFFMIVFSVNNPQWFTRFQNHLVLPFIFALSISLWSFGNGTRNLKTLTVQELVLEPLKEKKPYPWASKLFFTGFVGISLPLLVKVKLFNLTTLGLALEMWIVIIFYFLLILAPLAVIIGTAALLARYFLSIKEKIDQLLVRISTIAFVYPKGLNPQKINFIILILTFQLFLTLTSINSPFIENEMIYNQIGAEYATEYFSITENQAKTLEKIVLNDIPQITEVWTTTLGVGFDITSGRKILIYRYNATEIPERYPLTSSARTVLHQAFEKKQGIVLATGKTYARDNITLSFERNQNITITIIDERMTVPGFLYPKTEIYYSSGIPEPPEAIQLLVPSSIPFENIKSQEKFRIQFFSKDFTSEKIRNEITSLFQQYLEKYVYVNYSEQLSSPNSIVVSTQMLLFSIFASFSFILLFMTDLSSRRYLFGPYLIRGMTFRSMRMKLLIESFFLLFIATIVSWIVALVMVYWYSTMLQFSSLDPLILPIVPFDSQVLFFALVAFFVISYFLILKIKLKTGSLLPYISMENL